MTGRLAERLAAHPARRRRKQETRARLDAARAVGLERRHAEKLRRIRRRGGTS